jgi:NitT/TauT family transport system substrate-binding protein
MNNKTSAIGLLLVFVVCLSASCAGGSSAPAGKPIKVEWSLWQGDYTLLVANQMGFFKKNGVNVEPVRYDSSAQAIPDLAGAKLDGGLFPMSDVLLAASTADLKAVLVSDNGGQFTIIASPDIQSVQALRGKRIGLNLHSSSEMYVSSMLESGRMTSNDVTYVEMSPDQVLKAIPGQIDAGMVWEPYTSQAIQQGMNIVYQSKYDSSLIPRMVVFRKAVVDQRPLDIHAFILAWEEAVNYRISNPQESLAIISKATGLPASNLNLSQEYSIYTIKDNTKLFGNTLGNDPSSIYFIARFNRNFLITMGYITNPPDVGALLDPTYFK